MIENYIVVSKNIFSEGKFFDGYFIVNNGLIQKVYKKPYKKSDDPYKVFDFGENIIMPCIIDCHSFFTGYYVRKFGEDISSCNSTEDLIKKIKGKEINGVIIAKGLQKNLKLDENIFSKDFPDDMSILLFNWDEEFAFVNKKAKEKFLFDGKDFSSEGMWKILKFVLEQKNICKEIFIDYQKLLLSKGVSFCKDMAFDDSYGLIEILKEIEENNELILKMHFMSQPVGYNFSIENAKKIESILFNSKKLKFDGYNQMVDGSVSVKEADVVDGYEDGDFCKMEIDYEKLENDAILADSNGYRFSLHGQGDGAVSKIIDIFNKCKKNENGKLVNRHAITDLEFANPNSYKKMAELGIFAEIYPQILSIYDDSNEKINLTYERVGDRYKNYWNRRKMIDEGVIVSNATDLPLVIDDLGDSIYSGCYHKFNDGISFVSENAISLEEMLTCWTINGAKNLGIDKKYGKIEDNYFADFLVLNMNPISINENTAKDLKVDKTFISGKLIK